MQEKVGYIYIITNDCFKDNIVKIGKTSKTPDERCAELYSGNTGIPIPYNVYASLRTPNYDGVELALHRYFADKRINNNREWFSVSVDDVLNIFKVLLSCNSEASIEIYDNTAVDDEQNIISNKTSYEDFWNEFIAEVSNIMYTKSSNRGYLVHNIPGTYGVQINPAVTRNAVRVEIYLTGRDKQTNKDQFDYLFEHKEQIERSYGKPLIWNRLDDKNACRIYDQLDRDDDTTAIKFLSTHTIKLHDVILPYLLDFKESLK